MACRHSERRVTQERREKHNTHARGIIDMMVFLMWLMTDQVTYTEGSGESLYSTADAFYVSTEARSHYVTIRYVTLHYIT